MSTRASISIQNDKGESLHFYRGGDGHPKGVAELLRRIANSRADTCPFGQCTSDLVTALIGERCRLDFRKPNELYEYVIFESDKTSLGDWQIGRALLAWHGEVTSAHSSIWPQCWRKCLSMLRTDQTVAP